MKKEIEVWVDKDILYKRPNFVNFNVNTGEHKIINSLKATLIIEMPEKKIEITESEFDQQWVALDVLTMDQADAIRRLREKLFCEKF